VLHTFLLQAHKFLLGLAPVHALVRVGGAVSAVLNAPPVTRGVSRGMALAATAAAVPLSGIRKLQEGRMATQVGGGYQFGVILQSQGYCVHVIHAMCYMHCYLERMQMGITNL
jgi:hypothetical protein